MVYEFIYRHRWLLLLATVLSIISAVSGIGILSLINQEIEMLGKGQSDIIKGIIIFCLSLGALFVFGLISQYILIRLSATVTASLRDKMVQRILSTNYEQIEKLGGHKVYATLTGDINAISTTLGVLPHIVYNLATVIFCLSYMAYTSWQLFLCVFLFLGIAVVVAQLLMNKGMKLFEDLRELDDGLFKNFKALIDGGKELNINVNRKHFFYHQVVHPDINKLRQSSIGANIIFVILSNWASLMLFISLGSIVFASQLLFTGMTTEIIVGFVLVVIYMIGPLTVLIDSYSTIAMGFVANKKISSLKLSETEKALEHQDKVAIQASHDWMSLKVSDLYYEYEPQENDQYVFGVGPIDVSLKRGDLIFLIGGNGSGKSTFAKLLCGLYTASSGDISIDDVSASDAGNRDWYRCHFSTIFSDFYLFDQVLNASGCLADDRQIVAYLEKLRLADKVSVDKGILSTTSLSHGQKKRLALLLAYLEDTPIYIFDEWAADQDPYFRNFFYTELLPELKAKQKTVLVISHDEQYFDLADRVLKFDKGKMIEITDHLPEKVFVAVSEKVKDKFLQSSSQDEKVSS